MYVYSVLILEEIKFYGKKVQVKQAWLTMRGTLIRSIFVNIIPYMRERQIGSTENILAFPCVLDPGAPTTLWWG